MKKFLEICLGVVMVLTLIITIFSIIDESEKKKSYERSEKEVIEQLEEKYGDGNFKIEERNTKDCGFLSYCETETTMSISTDYLKEDFIISYEDNNYRYGNFTEDTFLEELYEENWYQKGVSFEEYLKEQKTNWLNDKIIDKELQSKIALQFEYMTVDFRNVEFGKKPELEDLIENAYIGNPYLNVNGYEKEDLQNFTKDIKKTYENLEENQKKYDYYLPARLGIKFETKNPFNENNNYNYYNSGYIRKDGVYYHIYVSSDPIEIGVNE